VSRKCLSIWGNAPKETLLWGIVLCSHWTSTVTCNGSSCMLPLIDLLLAWYAHTRQMMTKQQWYKPKLRAMTAHYVGKGSGKGLLYDYLKGILQGRRGFHKYQANIYKPIMLVLYTYQRQLWSSSLSTNPNIASQWHQQEHMLLPDFFLVTSIKVSQVTQVHQSYLVFLFLIYFLKWLVLII